MKKILVKKVCRLKNNMMAKDSMMIVLRCEMQLHSLAIKEHVHNKISSIHLYILLLICYFFFAQWIFQIFYSNLQSTNCKQQTVSAKKQMSFKTCTFKNDCFIFNFNGIILRYVYHICFKDTRIFSGNIRNFPCVL